MPKVALPVTNANEFQTRQIGYSIANEIMKEMRFNKDAQIFLTNSDGDIIQEGTQLERWKNADNVRNADSSDRLTIKVEKEVLEDMGLTYPTKKYIGWNRPIFVDKGLNIYLTPVYAPTRMTINFSFDFSNEGTAKKWVREAIRRFAEGRQDQTHRIKYSYLIPNEYTYMLHQFYLLRENVDGYNDLFEDWLTACLDGRVTAITNIIGNVNTAHLNVPEVQQNVHGFFEGPFEENKVQKENDASRYRIEFDYIIFYEDVTDLVLEYPVMIHNQVLQEGVLRDNPMKQIRYTDPAKGSLPNQWMNNFVFFNEFRVIKSFLDAVPGYNIPSFDNFEFADTEINSYFEHYFSILIEVDPDNRKYAFSLEELKDNGEDSLTYTARWKDFLRQELPFLNINDASVLHARHYPTLDKNIFYQIDPEEVPDASSEGYDLVFNTVVDMSLRTINHISFFICTDLRRINITGLKRLLCWPDVIQDIFTILKIKVQVPEPIVGTCLTMNQLNNLFIEVYGEGIRGYSMKTVNTASIYTRRR